MTAFHALPTDPKDLRKLSGTLMAVAARIERGAPVMPSRTMREVLLEAVATSQFTEEALTGPSRHRPLFKVRAEAMRIMHDDFGFSLSQIGNTFGGRHHTSVLHALRRARAWKAASA